MADRPPAPPAARAPQRRRPGPQPAAHRPPTQAPPSRPTTAAQWQRRALAAYRQGQIRVAADAIARALKLAPRQPRLLVNQGVILRAFGRDADAEASYRRALALAPSSADAHFNLGNLLSSRGALEEAALCYERAAAAQPGFVEAMNSHGALLARLGQTDRALEAFGRALEEKPGYAAAHLNRGNVLSSLKRYPEAQKAFQRAVELEPAAPGAYLACARMFLETERPQLAARLLRRALEARPDDVRLLLALAGALERLQRFALAARAYRRALAVDEASSLVHLRLGRMLVNVPNGLARGTRHLRRALELHPGSVDARAALAQALVSEGKNDDAERLLREVLAEAPDHAGAYRLLAHIHKSDAPGAEDLPRMEALVAAPTTPAPRRIELEYALAEAYDAKGDYDRAFAHLAAANDADGKRRPYDLGRPSRQLEANRRVYTPGFFAERRGWGSPSTLPVFIVGMPRSGTTLTEQILASHPQVFGAGELREIGQLRAKVGPLLGSRKGYPAVVADLGKEQVARLAEEHVAFLGRLGKGAARVTDKSPFNYTALGLIALLFPNAKVIFCKRNPLDNCLSCYFLRFTEHMAFATDLGQLGQFYRIHEQQMAAWRETLSLPILEMRYEELVDDQEAQTRRLLEFCGLPWDDRCLRFHETERPVQTPSNWQVRQPLYKRSSGRWRNYQAHLGPLVAALGLGASDLAAL